MSVTKNHNPTSQITLSYALLKCHSVIPFKLSKLARKNISITFGQSWPVHSQFKKRMKGVDKGYRYRSLMVIGGNSKFWKVSIMLFILTPTSTVVVQKHLTCQQYKAASKSLPGPYHDSKIESYDIPKATWYLYSLLGSVKVSVAASEILTSLDVLSSNPGTDSWNTAPWTSFHFLYILIPISRIRWTKCGCKGISKSSFKCWSNSELVVPDAGCRNLENLRSRVFASFWANLRGWVALFALAKVASCTLALQHQAAHTAWWLHEECIPFLHHIFLVKSGRKVVHHENQTDMAWTTSNFKGYATLSARR